MSELYQIYLITNKINSKLYVGQVIQHRGYKNRFKEHLGSVDYANTRMLSNAIKKYGKENFSVELIEKDIPEDLIDEKEKYYIDYYKSFYTFGNGYNMTIGGQGVHGYKHTELDCRKISENGLKNWCRLREDSQKLEARNNKISEKLKGRPKSDITKLHLSEAAKKRFETEAGTFTGRKHSEKSKRLVAEKNGYKVGMYDKNTGELLLTFISTCEAARYLITEKLTNNLSCATRIRTICNNVKGQGKTAYGYVWKYLS